MAIEVCKPPLGSAIGHQTIMEAYFCDAYCTDLQHPKASVVDIFFGVFGHNPWWIRRVLMARNRLASLGGLDVPADRDILSPQRKSSYAAGDTIGPWPLFFLSEQELVAGRNNKHLDFRLSVLRTSAKPGVGQPGEKRAAQVVISTVCTTHNTFGKLYLFFIVPFHKRGVQWLMTRAVVAGRL